MSDMAVPQNVYRHLQAGFAVSNARRCVEYERDRIFHPGDVFVDVLRWLWGGIDSPLTSGESLACTLLADHFAAVNAILAEQEPPAAPMTIDEMITGLRVAGLESYAGPAEYQRICAMIREDVPAMTGYTAEGEPADLMVPRQEPPAGKWDASVPVTYSGEPREDPDDVETGLGQVTITEPGDSRRIFTHYPEHPDDPDHRRPDVGVPRQRPDGDRRAHPERRSRLRDSWHYRSCRGNARRSPFADARGIHRRNRGEVPQRAGPGELATQPQCRTGMGQQMAGRERCERGSKPRNLIR